MDTARRENLDKFIRAAAPPVSGLILDTDFEVFLDERKTRKDFIGLLERLDGFVRLRLDDRTAFALAVGVSKTTEKRGNKSSIISFRRCRCGRAPSRRRNR